MSDFAVQTIKPGILIAGKASIKGGIHYKRDYEEPIFEEDSLIREWHTQQLVDDEKEHASAKKLQNKIASMINRICAHTPIGPICRNERKDELVGVLAEIRAQRDTFNNKAKTCQITTHHALFEVQSDNQTAVAAIADQVAEMADKVNSALTVQDLKALRQTPKRWLKGMSPDAIMELDEEKRNAILARARAELIRKAIADVRGVHQLLPQSASKEMVSVVVKARDIARKLCKRVEKKNEALDSVINEVDLGGIRRTRNMFIAAAVKASKKAAIEETKKESSEVGPAIQVPKRKISIPELTTQETNI